MFKKLAQKKKRSSSAELPPSSSKTYFDVQERAPIRVAKKEIPLSRGGSPVLLMPKPKHATPPTRAVLTGYEHDKTEIEEVDILEELEEEEQGLEEEEEEKYRMADEYVRALQHQVLLIQRQCELERSEWRKREEEHRRREREMMETIYQTQGQLRLVAGQRQQIRMRELGRSTVPAEEDSEEEQEEEDEYLELQHSRPRPMRSRRNSASSFHDPHDPFPAYHCDLSNPFPAGCPIVRPNSIKSAMQHQYYRRQRRPSSTFYDC